MSICPVPAPVVPSEQVKDPSIKGLQKCFDPQCDKKLNSDSCDGIVGCYWCVAINTKLLLITNTAPTLIHVKEERKVRD